jgi:hypothetical protein
VGEEVGNQDEVDAAADKGGGEGVPADVERGTKWGSHRPDQKDRPSPGLSGTHGMSHAPQATASVDRQRLGAFLVEGDYGQPVAWSLIADG